MIITVTDHITVDGDVTAQQALAYCRRVLAGWDEAAWMNGTAVEFSTIGPTGESLYCVCPTRDGRDAPRMIAAICNTLVQAGIVKQPSEALRAMQAERATP